MVEEEPGGDVIGLNAGKLILKDVCGSQELQRALRSTIKVKL